MVEVYYHDNQETPEDSAERHHSGKEVSLDKLSEIGVFYRHVETIEELDKIADERGYKNRDTVCMNLDFFGGDLNAYNAKMEQFYKEHYHEDEEIRYVIDGEGYFDVKDKEDKWIRAKLNKFDLLVLPAGIFHRFTLTSETKYVKTMRLFKDEPKWEAINRDTACESDARKQYIRSIAV